MPDGEAERLFLEGGGTVLDSNQYPCCPNRKCRHKFFDAAPGNATADEENTSNMTQYMALCEEFKAYKRKEGPQPVDPVSNRPLEKMPPAPKAIKKYGRCHCSQTYADPRHGKKCPVNCKYEGVTFPTGKCPICLCVCKAFVPLDQYNTIVTVSSLGKTQRNNNQGESQKWIEKNLNVNLMQQNISSQAYRQMSADGDMDFGSSVVSNVANQGALAQSLNMVGNPPDHATRFGLRRRVDSMQHAAGPSFTSVGDMNIHGRTSAADIRKTNNGLLSDYVPTGMTEEQQLHAAMTASGNDDMMEDELVRIALMESNDPELISKPAAYAHALPPVHAPMAVHATPMNSGTVLNNDTPICIVNTRNKISKNRHEKCKSMTKGELKVSMTLIKNLYRPHKPEYVNGIAAIK